MDSDTRVRQEAAGPDGGVLYQWYCKTCHGYGGWTGDEAQARADRAAHQCPDMTKAAPPDHEGPGGAASRCEAASAR